MPTAHPHAHLQPAEVSKAAAVLYSGSSGPTLCFRALHIRGASKVSSGRIMALVDAPRISGPVPDAFLSQRCQRGRKWPTCLGCHRADPGLPVGPVRREVGSVPQEHMLRAHAISSSLSLGLSSHCTTGRLPVPSLIRRSMSIYYKVSILPGTAIQS